MGTYKQGAVSKADYIFNSASNTIVFSSNYSGLTLSDIFNITNAKSGVATTIYDPYNSVLGGTLTGLTLTLFHDTGDMSDSDPLIIIIGKADLPTLVTLPNSAQEQGGNLENISSDLDAIQETTDLLGAALRDNENVFLQTKDFSIKKDQYGAIILSDSDPIQVSSTTTTVPLFKIDTTGYNTLSIQAIIVGATVTVQGSNDGFNWASIYGVVSSLGTNSTQLSTAPAFYTFPCVAKYIRAILSSNATCTIIYQLRQGNSGVNSSLFGQAVNIMAVGGTANPSTNVSGMMSVGGNIATGIAPTANPILIAGVSPITSNLTTTDTAVLTRRLLTDSSGRLIQSGTDQVSVGRPTQVTLNANNGYSLLTQDLSRSEGLTLIELMSQLLLEQQITNQYLSALPDIMQGTFNTKFEEPQTLRNDPSFIN